MITLMLLDVLKVEDARVWQRAEPAAELTEAATYFERAAALEPAPAVKDQLTHNAACCRAGEADAM